MEVGPMAIEVVASERGLCNGFNYFVLKQTKQNNYDERDLVLGNPEESKFHPFYLSIEGDKLWGCGTTDYLGHIVLITELMRQLGEVKPNLKSTIVVVFFCTLR
ncbi:hypothetical protein SUGI_0326720 [Cryptomeria japonica]|nr:hypothetical protein SUGI_0326720 [Cryptomeria japonica]